MTTKGASSRQQAVTSDSKLATILQGFVCAQLQETAMQVSVVTVNIGAQQAW